MQSKYVYPAVFTKEGEQYSVAFPDIGGCYTCGDSLVEAVSNAQDALCLMLYDMEESGEVIPAPSDAWTLRKPWGTMNLSPWCPAIPWNIANILTRRP